MTSALIHLEAADDHVERLAHEQDPVRAVLELVWNGLDADAHEVRVELLRNEAGGVDGVVVTDDGHGMSPEQVDGDFRWIGGSWKRSSRRSRGEGRPLHGRSGQGRLRVFALGHEVRWTTVAQDGAGRLTRSEVRASSARRSDFAVESTGLDAGVPGTRVEARGRQGLHRLETDAARSAVTAALAPYLMSQGHVDVVYDGTRVVVADTVAQHETVDLHWQHAGVRHEAVLQVIEWRGRHRSFQLCDDEGVVVEELQTPVARDFAFSAYVQWEHMPRHAGESVLVDLGARDTPLAPLLELVQERLEEHFEQRRSQGRRDQVGEWHRRGTHPFPEQALDPAQELQRAVFDVVATTIRRHVPRPVTQQRLVLGLLRETLRRQPAEAAGLLHDLLGLAGAERREIEDLLHQDSLATALSPGEDSLFVGEAWEHLRRHHPDVVPAQG